MALFLLKRRKNSSALKHHNIKEQRYIDRSLVQNIQSCYNVINDLQLKNLRQHNKNKKKY